MEAFAEHDFDLKGSSQCLANGMKTVHAYVFITGYLLFIANATAPVFVSCYSFYL